MSVSRDSFTKKNSTGTKGEKLVCELFTANGISCEKEPDKKLRYDHDLIAKIDDIDFTIEVKFDMMARFTGNIAMEYRNSKKDSPSGIAVTKADLWMILLSTTEGPQIYAASVSAVKQFMATTEPFKKIQSGGDGNADIFLYKKDVILPIFKNLTGYTAEQLKDFLYANLGISPSTTKDTA